MNEQPNMQDLRKKVSKTTKIVAFTALGIVVAGILLLLILNWILSRGKGDDIDKNIYFYPISDENIFESAEYLGLDRAVYYCDNASGYNTVIEPITEEDRKKFPAEVQFLEIYLMSIISGDNEMYRSLFSDAYLQRNTLPTFTQQMLYNICIYRVGNETGENGQKLSVYRVEYMIRKNNGTFRRDVESDAIRPQFVVLSETENNSFLIENVYGKQYQK